ncbi:HAD-IIIA family hydrolase [Mumia zhuanghuii]|uniref:D,D-heptose 1,7-bisphosphate phosphatase n=1 Tax=Mumia zhuanghuii TaxID=2585211 RepID=A0A5C4MD44_9ACTN|nr:HAD-IIIA family hydrolase [Mumia zhuanghuii]TNC36597.1 HAD-IIIA family hydrolase [Mumia zhuanghuii]TNC46350.1 HAD-IIIA family hydrolase [Mumia zhuanghuii]
MSGTVLTTVVVPTVGRASLSRVLAAVRPRAGWSVADVVVVDDRPDDDGPDDDGDARPGLAVGDDVRVVRSYGRGPAGARNVGIRAARTPWVSFLDDDVEPELDWLAHLAADLAEAPPDVAGIQGRVVVPLTTERRPDDFARSTAGLATARWITADMTYRRAALLSAGGFDERFPRAYREDADLALRVQRNGARLVRGRRTVVHPVRAESDGISVRQQRGNADDRLMDALHGPQWRARADAPRGRISRHVAVTACAVAAGAGLLTRRRRVGTLALAAWAAGTTDLFLHRWLPGSRSAAETRRMAWTSAVIPVAATWHSAQGWWRHRRAAPWPEQRWLVLFDRDGTLVHDVPYNADPEKVDPVDGAAEALAVLRGGGAYVGVVTNQSGVGRGLLTHDEVDAVNARVDELLGPFDVWKVCPHAPDDGCDCRKPGPAMVRDACGELGVPEERCVVIGDIGADVDAARAAGATGILVPTAVTRPEEVTAAAFVRADLQSSVASVLAWMGQGEPR